MDDIFTYLVDIPGKTKEVVMPCLDGFTIYIDNKLDRQAQINAYNHAIKHIKSGDFDKEDVSIIELDVRRTHEN